MREEYDSPEELADQTLFSPQEAAVVWHVLRGLSNAEIASQLDIPKKQVEMHRYQRIPKKIERARTEAAQARATASLGDRLD